MKEISPQKKTNMQVSGEFKLLARDAPPTSGMTSLQGNSFSSSATREVESELRMVVGLRRRV